MVKMTVSDGELEIMKVLWHSSPRTLPEIIQQVQTQRDWEGVTIKTMLGRLLKKGAVMQSGSRRNYLYAPKLGREEYLSDASESFLKQNFGGAAAMMSFLVKRGQLSSADLTELQQQIAKLEDLK